MKQIRCENCGNVGGKHNHAPDGLLAEDGFTFCCGAAYTITHEHTKGRLARLMVSAQDEGGDLLSDALGLSSRDLERMLPGRG